jgi:hypothetical protein
MQFAITRQNTNIQVNKHYLFNDERNKTRSIGPGVYFKDVKKEAKEKKAPAADANGDKKKPPERLNFLSDAEYLGLNLPAPGTYNLSDGWAKLGKKGPSKEGDKKDKFKYVPGGWRPKNDQLRGPGQYEVTRIMSVEVDKDKGKKKFKTIPVYERPKMGVINKVNY